MSLNIFQDNIGSKGIETSDWKPNHPEFEYPKHFTNWIDSINSGWQNKLEYKPFDLYCNQAKEWLNDNSMITDFDNEEDQLEWLMREILH